MGAAKNTAVPKSATPDRPTPTRARNGSARSAPHAEANRLASGVVGALLRARREALGISLRQFARDLDVSASFISQLETGKAQPSVATFYSICAALDLSIDELFAAAESGPEGGRTDASNNEWRAGADTAHAREAGADSGDSPLVHPDERRVIDLDSGVTWESLTARHDKTDFMFVRYDVGGSSTLDGRLIRHVGTEYGYVIRGVLEVTLGFNSYVLRAGDSISFDSSRPHRLVNIGDEPVEAIWVNLEFIRS
jgi:transcriptional regulator with XRE-family HTH domain